MSDSQSKRRIIQNNGEVNGNLLHYHSQEIMKIYYLKKKRNPRNSMIANFLKEHCIKTSILEDFLFLSFFFSFFCLVLLVHFNVYNIEFLFIYLSIILLHFLHPFSAYSLRIVFFFFHLPMPYSKTYPLVRHSIIFFLQDSLIYPFLVIFPHVRFEILFCLQKNSFLTFSISFFWTLETFFLGNWAVILVRFY